MSRFKKLLHDKKLMSGIYAVTLVTALLILALVIKGPEESGRLVADRNGNITGINRRSMDRSERYDLSLEIEAGSEIITRDVTLTLQAESGGRIGAGTDREETREAEIDAAVDNMIRPSLSFLLTSSSISLSMLIFSIITPAAFPSAVIRLAPVVLQME